MPGGNTIRRTTTTTGLTGVGVFIFPSGPLPRLRADVRRKAVAVIAPFPWGPESALWKVTSASDLLARHIPLPDQTVYPAIAGVPFRDLYAVRPAATGAAAATVTMDTAAAADSLVVTARYKGALGNSIRIDTSANADVSTSRDVRVRVIISGVTYYDKSYPAVQIADGTVTDPGDELVSFAKASGASAQVAATNATLSGGSDGTLSAANVLAALDLCGGASSKVGIVCFAGVGTSLCDDVNDGLKTWLADADKGGAVIGIGPTPGALDASDAVTEIEAYDQERMVRLWPRIRRFGAYNFRGNTASGEFTVCGGPMMAAFIQNCDPWEAPMMSVISDKRLNSGILGLETDYEATGLDTLADLEDAGATPWFYHEDFGIVPKASNTTLIDSGVVEPIEERRYIMFLEDIIARYLEAGIGKPLDLNLADSTLGTYTGRTVGALEAFLHGEEKAGRLIAGLNDDDSASPAYLVDAFGAATSENVTAGRWDLAISARLTPTQRQVVFHATLGRSVNIIVT